MANVKKYRVLLSWMHRKWGPQQEKLSAEGSSLRSGLNHALRAFFSDKSNTERRRDAHAGLDVKIWRLKRE